MGFHKSLILVLRLKKKTYATFTQKHISSVEYRCFSNTSSWGCGDGSVGEMLAVLV